MFHTNFFLNSKGVLNSKISGVTWKIKKAQENILKWFVLTVSYIFIFLIPEASTLSKSLKYKFYSQKKSKRMYKKKKKSCLILLKWMIVFKTRFEAQSHLTGTASDCRHFSHFVRCTHNTSPLTMLFFVKFDPILS